MEDHELQIRKRDKAMGKPREHHDRERVRNRQVAFVPVFAVTMRPMGDPPP
jgi:hypothetical protein